MLTPQCHVQGRVPILVLGIDAAASVHQQGHQPHVGLLHGQVQRGLELTALDIHVTAALGGGAEVQPRDPDGP